MFDVELAKEILSQIQLSAQTILKRFKPIKSMNDFIDTEEGLDLLFCAIVSGIVLVHRAP